MILYETLKMFHKAAKLSSKYLITYTIILYSLKILLHPLSRLLQQMMMVDRKTVLLPLFCSEITLASRMVSTFL